MRLNLLKTLLGKKIIIQNPSKNFFLDVLLFKKFYLKNGIKITNWKYIVFVHITLNKLLSLWIIEYITEFIILIKIIAERILIVSKTV